MRCLDVRLKADTTEIKLPRQRIRADLELHDLALRALSAFDMPDKMCPVVRVKRPALPSGASVVDAPVHAARVEAERIRDAQRRPLARLRVEREQRVGIRSCRKR